MILSGQTYRCSAGETFDSASLAIYGDEKYACELLCANPELCTKMMFSGGELLKIPVVEITGQEDDEESYMPPVAPWME